MLTISDMELYDLIDVLEGKKRLCEMAFPRKDVVARLLDRPLKVNRFYHLVLIYYFRNEREVDHWKREMSSFVPESFPLKGKNKRFDEKTTFEYVWEGLVDDPAVAYDVAFSNAKFAETDENGFSSLPWGSVVEDPESVLSFMADFHSWTAGVLAKNGEVKSGPVVAKIDELLEKYPLL